MRTLPALLVAALALGPTAALAKPSAGAGAKGGACGAAVLPLKEGNSWTYTFVPAPAPAPRDIAPIAPPSAKTIVITVKSVETKGADTVVNLEEKVSYELKSTDGKKAPLDERVVKTTITCGAKKLDISPESFFFAGEPGGFGGLTLDKVERKGTSLQLTNGTFGEQPWPEDLVIQWSHKGAEGVNVRHDAGKLEIERRFQPQEPEQLSTKAGTYKAEKLILTVTGRVTLAKPIAPEPKPAEVPAGWASQLWFAEGTGMVQSLNHYAHMYQLVESTVK
jgi:hypothetical protein